MPTDHTEKGFEQAIEAHLLANGYAKANAADFSPALALDPVALVAFLKDTQPKEWAKLAGIYGAEAEKKIVLTVARDLDTRGMLDCLRHGVTDRGVKLRLAFFRPATGLNPETLALYGKNVLAVTRQVRFSEKTPHLSVDLLLSVTPAANTRPAPSGERLVDYEQDVAHYTTGQGTDYFGWADAADDPPRRLADKFIERFPEIAARGQGADPAYARWYAVMIDATEPGGLIIMYADWDTPEDHVPTLNVPDGVRVPLPPPGYGK